MQKCLNRSGYTVPMVEHTFRILEALCQSKTDIPLTELSSRTGVGNTSTFRILHTLMTLGYVEKDATTGRYHSSPKLLDFGRQSPARRSLVHLSRPHLERLCDEFNETVNLAVFRGEEIVYIEILESSEPFRMAAEIGDRAPFHSTALGKAICANIPKEQIEAMARKGSWTRYTAHTIGNLREFLQETNKVREQGYGFDAEESERGASCMATAIVNPATGIAVGGISISGPTHRIRAKQKLMLRKLRIATDEIAVGLGTIR